MVYMRKLKNKLYIYAQIMYTFVYIIQYDILYIRRFVPLRVRCTF